MLGRGCSVSARWATKAKLTNRCGSHIPASHFHRAAALQSIEIKMPSLSPTMQEGQIVKWFKEEGEAVMAGDVICDIQTDKAVVSLETDEDGTLAKILKNQDDGTIQIGTLIAVIAEDGEDWKEVGEQAKDTPSSGDQPQQAVETPAAAAVAQPTGGSTPGTEVKMPALSPTMQEGTIIKWCVEEGEKINAGDVICEIQTDKAVVSMEVDDDCVLAKILVPEGTANVQIGTLIAMTVDEGEDWKDVQIPAAVTLSATPTEGSADDVTTPAPAAPQAAPAAEAVPMVHLAGVGPATNLLLTQYGINPEALEASGPKGLTKSDVLAHIENKSLKPIDLSASVPLPAAATPAAAATAKAAEEPAKVKRPNFDRPASVGRIELGTVGGGGKYTDVPLTTMRSVIAKRLLQSKQTSPHGYSTAECNLDSIAQIRSDFAAAGMKVSVNDLVIKAAATALQYVPEVNINTLGEDDFQVMPSVDISVAVATESGLITPIVKNVPSLALNQISDTVRELATRAKAGKLQLDEFQGGSFTISNLGMFGISEFTAIINPPQGAILAVGMGSQQINPLTLKPSTFMKGTLAFDRRFIDEHLAAEFMATFRKVIENPQYMNIGPVPIVRNTTARAAAGFL